MKLEDWRLTDRTFVLAIRRLAMTHESIPHLCRIRKCHRERACTGPLVDFDGEKYRLERRMTHETVGATTRSSPFASFI
jgi:hypothetical protein